MDKKQKCESNNQWAGANISLTSQTNVKEKDENNNQWTSTCLLYTSDAADE